MSAQRERGQSGQVTVLLALALVGALLVSGVAVDGGYGLLQWRQAQNAADLGSEAAVQALQPACFGTASVSNQQVSAAISDLVASDAPQASGHWQGVYLTQGGSPVSGGPALPAATGSAPAGACGVSVQVTPTWT
ncbi:MAG TPA: pilus assembly protein TadG-related protein, partial [Bacillota bacterium]|nr:pilus assembly protein TadG-related protein [Bacillota bacterium]